MEIYSLPRNLLGARTKTGTFTTLDAHSPMAAAFKKAAETEHARVLAEVESNLNEDGSTDDNLSDLFNKQAAFEKGMMTCSKNDVPIRQRSWKAHRGNHFRAA